MQVNQQVLHLCKLTFIFFIIGKLGFFIAHDNFICDFFLTSNMSLNILFCRYTCYFMEISISKNYSIFYCKCQVFIIIDSEDGFKITFFVFIIYKQVLIIHIRFFSLSCKSCCSQMTSILQTQIYDREGSSSP